MKPRFPHRGVGGRTPESGAAEAALLEGNRQRAEISRP
jgi:hypothetical protein